MEAFYEEIDVLRTPYEAFEYKLTPDNGIRAHWHYYMEIIYFTENGGMIGDGSRIIRIEEGQLAVFPPKTVHFINGTDQSAIYQVLKFDPYLLGNAGLGDSNFGTLFSCAQGDPKAPMILTREMLADLQIKQLFHQIIAETEGRKYGYSLLIRCYTIELLLKIVRSWRNMGFDTDRAITQNSEIRNVAAYIYAHAGENLVVQDLARNFHMSYSHFAKLFREMYGRSCAEYISYVRVNRVCEMLQSTDFDLNYISHECGFADCSHMIRVFKKSEAMTPGKYRQIHRGGE